MTKFTMTSEGFEDVDRSSLPDVRYTMPDGSTSTVYVKDALVALMALGDVIILHSNGVAALYVTCSDTFAYACADAEPVPATGFTEKVDLEVLDLYDRARASSLGPIAWVALRRNMRPLLEVERAMKRDGSWTEELDGLPLRD